MTPAQVRAWLLDVACPSGWTCERCGMRWDRPHEARFGAGVTVRCASCGRRTQLVTPLVTALLASEQALLESARLVAFVANKGPAQAVSSSDDWATFAYYRLLRRRLRSQDAQAALGLESMPAKPARRSLGEEIARERNEKQLARA